MISNKRLIFLCMTMYILILVYHIFYSIFYCSTDQTIRSCVWSVCVLIVLAFFIKFFKSQFSLVVHVTMLAMIATVTYVGYVLRTLAFAVVIYFAASLVVGMFQNYKYVLVWGLGSFGMLIMYTLLWPDMILEMVPSMFLFYGYLMSYLIGLIYTYLLVKASQKHFSAITTENRLTKIENASKNLFWANISNEIRTPMNVINGMSRLLRTENLNTRAREYTDQIENASTMLLTIVNDTLELSNIETGNYEIRNENYDIYRVAHMSVMYASANCHSDNVSLLYSINPQIPLILKGDDNILTKIVVRLLNNALIFTEKGEIRLDIDYNNKYKEYIELIIKVSDTGVGIPDAELMDLFSGFDNNSIGRTTEQETVGLSLKLCKSLVNLLDGNIEVSSVLGAGSTFKVSLIQQIGDSDKAVNLDNDIAYLSDISWKSTGSKVLVVDDTPTNLKLISGMIRLFGIEPDNAESGKEALEMMENTKYDLIFLDYMMPNMNGEDTLKQIKARNTSDNFKDVVVIALSSKSLQRDRNKFMEMGFDEFISKPIDDKELERLLRKFLTEKQ